MFIKNIIFKVITTSLILLLSIVIGILVPRVIGPVNYGELNYVISTYGFLFQLTMLSAGVAYVFFLSGNKYNNEEVNSLYFSFIFIVSILVVFIGMMSISSELGIMYLWNGLENKYLLYLGLIFGMFANIQQRLLEYSDSTGQTIQAEKIKLLSKVLIVITIILLVFFETLDVYLYLMLSILGLILFIALFFKYISISFSKISTSKSKIIINDFYVYLRPLAIFTLISSVYSYIGKYTLQASSGSLEQGLYNFALQFSLIPVAIVISIATIYMSEIKKKHENNDINGVRKLYIYGITRVYALHAIVSIFIILNAKAIITLTVGNEYIGAVESLQVLSIFSLLHTFGIFSSQLFFGSDRNRQYSVINSSVMALGVLFFIYILLFKTINSIELSILTVSFYMLRVLIQLYFNMDYLEVNKVKFLYKIFVISLTILLIFEVVGSFEYNLLASFSLSLILLLIVNFLCGDYMNLNKIIRIKNGIS
jgi:O-antigen/teichoic acid export membrane protein